MSSPWNTPLWPEHPSQTVQLLLFAAVPAHLPELDRLVVGGEQHVRAPAAPSLDPAHFVDLLFYFQGFEVIELRLM
jgi:hypothetical protein